MDFKINPIIVFIATLIVYVVTLQLVGASLGFVSFLSKHFFHVFNFCFLVKFVATKFMNVATYMLVGVSSSLVVALLQHSSLVLSSEPL